MPIRTTHAVLTIGLLLGGNSRVVPAQSPRFEVVIAGTAPKEPVTGRLIVVLAKNREPEPRYQISPSGAAMFADDFYLNLAVYRFEEFAKATKNPVSDATFTYGRPTKGHSWHAFPWAELVRRMDAHVTRNGRQ